jgi:hypothetical protein
MRRIIKLTPATIKRIIAEEKEKLQAEKKQKLLEQLKLLKKIKNRQMNSLSEAKQLHNMKKKLIKSIKGEK